MKAVTIRMDDEIHKEIKDMAWMNRVSINSYIIQAIQNQLLVDGVQKMGGEQESINERKDVHKKRG